MEGNCERAVQVLQNYLEEFPQGSFATNAYFYLAECLAEQNRQEEALRSYDEVISRPRNIFTEPALVEAASIAYRQKNYFDALEYYLIMEQVAERPANQTEALKGQLRCYYHLKNYARVNETGERLLQLTGLPEDMVRETHYKMARAYRETGKPEKALEHYRAISEDVSSVMGAEAKYRVAELYFETGEIDKAEAEIFSMIDMNTPTLTGWPNPSCCWGMFWWKRATISRPDIPCRVCSTGMAGMTTGYSKRRQKSSTRSSTATCSLHRKIPSNR